MVWGPVVWCPVGLDSDWIPENESGIVSYLGVLPRNRIPNHQLAEWNEGPEGLWNKNPANSLTGDRKV